MESTGTATRQTAIIEFFDSDNKPDIEVTVDRRGNIVKAKAWCPGLIKWLDATSEIMLSDWWRAKVNKEFNKIQWIED